jgi:hypothetical protein
MEYLVYPKIVFLNWDTAFMCFDEAIFFPVIGGVVEMKSRSPPRAWMIEDEDSQVREYG